MRRFLIILSLLATAGCGQQDVAVELRFVAMLDGEPVECSDAGPALSDLRFYVSDVSLLSDQYVQADIVDKEVWQSNGVALIDLENGQGTCANGTPDMNDTVSMVLPEGNARDMSLTIGVPFNLNHANPLLAASPLNDSAMHWHWRSGYKFLRAGVESDDGEAWIHLGSTGCQGTVGDITGCNAPNRVSVELTNFDPATDRIAINLSALLDAQAMLADSDRLDCSSGPAEAACEQPFTALGIPFGNEETLAPQQVFSVLK